ncbi:MAG: HAD family hydrolase [Bacteroidales bacterium]|nr:HAD family hydrolase [Bacteroidales bacterium]
MKKKAIFLDRDGTINNNAQHYYIWRREDLQLNPGVIETLRELQARGYMLIVISNQGGISKGEYSAADVEALHEYLRGMLEQKGVHLDEICYCPHHPDQEACLCRKPKALMIEKALARFRIDRAASWMIGDSRRDVEAGKAAGLRTIRIESNSDLREILETVDRGTN